MYKKEEYKAVGLVEVLIAMAVASIAIALFINMTSTTYREAIRMERQDALTRLAYRGALGVRRYAEWTRDPMESGDTFDEDRCYAVDEGVDEDEILDNDIWKSVSSDMCGNNDFKYNIEYGDNGGVQEQAYMGFCIDHRKDLDEGTMYMGYIVTGYVQDFEDVEDYTYNLAIIIYDD